MGSLRETQSKRLELSAWSPGSEHNLAYFIGVRGFLSRRILAPGRDARSGPVISGCLLAHRRPPPGRAGPGPGPGPGPATFFA